MAHHCQEHWASQHTWQTMPVEAEGQRSAGSGIGSEQAEQEGMAVGSVIDPHNAQSSTAANVCAFFERFGFGVADAIGALKRETGLVGIGVPADKRSGRTGVFDGDDPGGHWKGCDGMDPPSSRGLAGWGAR